MLAGELYRADDPELVADAARCAAWLERYILAGAADAEQRHALLLEGLGSVGDGAVIRPPFHCDYGYNITLGAGAFLNFGCVVLDVVPVTIGVGSQIGPGVQLLAADHPRDAALRRQGLELGRPIHIGANVWIGAGAMVLPGVSIGDDAVVGAGSVVTRSVGPGCKVAGNPARVLGRG